jgi:hypothetical protein
MLDLLPSFLRLAMNPNLQSTAGDLANREGAAVQKHTKQKPKKTLATGSPDRSKSPTSVRQPNLIQTMT